MHRMFLVFIFDLLTIRKNIELYQNHHFHKNLKGEGEEENDGTIEMKERGREMEPH